MRLLPALVLLTLSTTARAAGPPAPPRDAKAAVRDGLAFLARESTLWKDTRRCATCHHAPMAIWALNEAKRHGFTVDDKALADLSAWVVAKDDPAKVFPKQAPQKEAFVNQAPLLLALAVEAGDAKAAQEGLRKMLSAVLEGQG